MYGAVTIHLIIFQYSENKPKLWKMLKANFNEEILSLTMLTLDQQFMLLEHEKVEEERVLY